MAKGIMQEAVDQDEFDRMDKGLPPKPRPKVAPLPDPAWPDVKMMLYADFTDDVRAKITKIKATQKSHKNPDGIRFVGYEVAITFEDKSSISGWMGNKDFVMLRHDLFTEGKVDVASILDV